MLAVGASLVAVTRPVQQSNQQHRDRHAQCRHYLGLQLEQALVDELGAVEA